jgi:glutathione S-transferase
MKLFYASGSPYARIARELRLEPQVAERAGDALEARMAGGAYGGPIDAAQIVLGAALENTARRHKVWEWRSTRPRLSAFLDTIARRPSFAATVQPEINL